MSTESRRERQRAQTRNEIKATARQQMAERGSAELSLGAVARAMGLSTPSLYHYFADRDALLTALIFDAFTSLAEALEASVADLPPTAYAERILTAWLTYRAWALAHPVDFQLIYGNPVPGYQAPAEVTVPAVRRGFAVLLEALLGAHAAGMLRPHPAHFVLPPELHFTLLAPDDGAIPPEVAAIALSTWITLHGAITLELFNHLQPVVSNLDAFYRHQVVSLLAEVGLALPE
jgi:AcrR family transcriptional regulator